MYPYPLPLGYTPEPLQCTTVVANTSDGVFTKRGLNTQNILVEGRLRFSDIEFIIKIGLLLGGRG